MSSFKSLYNLEDSVIQGLDALGYLEPMAVQKDVIDSVLEGKDLIVQSQTGSGKTAAFAIPLVEKCDIECGDPQVLVLTPTRELAVQVCEEISHIGKYKKIRSVPLYGKQAIHVQLRQLKQRVHVAVGTPGRVADLIKRKNLVVDKIKYLVIDEADELLKRGFIEEVEGIIRRLPDERVTLLFSATMPLEIQGICERYMVEPVRIETVSNQAPIDQINQSWFEVADDWKFPLLTKMMAHEAPESCIIFCNTRAKVDQLVQKLNVGRYSCAGLHGGMPQGERLRAIDAFKDKRITYLVTSDLAARGIHVDQLDLVINYNVPQDSENYVHRIGRTGRAGEKGKAITFVSEHDRRKWQEVMTFIGYEVPQGNQEMLTHTAPTRVAKKPREVIPRAKKLHKDVVKIRINAGKNKKMRAADILGAIINMPGMSMDDIGIIDIQETCSYVEIFNKKGITVLEKLSTVKIKGKTFTAKKV